MINQCIWMDVLSVCVGRENCIDRDDTFIAHDALAKLSLYLKFCMSMFLLEFMMCSMYIL